MVNAQTETLFGYERGELIGQPVEMLVPPRLAARHAKHRVGFKAEPHRRQMGAAIELFAQRKQGDELPVDIMLSSMIVDDQHFTLCVVRDITERKAAEDRLRHQTAELQKLHAQLKQLANQDSLTGLLNRRAFFEHANQLLKTARRRKESAALLMIDLDHFKRVNDRFGHAEGDRVLKAVAAALKATARENDIVARYGGEEFVVAILGVDEAESVVAAERLREAIAAISGTKCRITASIGVASLIPDQHQREISAALTELLGQSDRALYAAKDHGRNRVCHHNKLSELAYPAKQPTP